jgi:hypothetical protein
VIPIKDNITIGAINPSIPTLFDVGPSAFKKFLSVYG